MQKANHASYIHSGAIGAWLESTGEKAPCKWYAPPVDPVDHGGYLVKRGLDILAGPFLWVENAAAEAGRLGAIVVRACPDKVYTPRCTQRTSETKASNYLGVRSSKAGHAATLARLRSIGLRAGEAAR
jgi:hypothetical protein